MVALKHEVNGMLAAAGNSNKYVIDDPVEHEDLLEALLAVEQGVAS